MPSRLLPLLLLLLPLLLCDGASLPRRVRRAIIRKTSTRWADGVVPYIINLALTDAERANITAAMDTWAQETCVTFRPKQRGDLNYLKVVDGNKCHSLVGRQHDTIPQDLILQTNCRMYGVVLHELGHALGLLHEHNRPGRDEFITVAKSRAFNKLENANDVLNYETPYDFQSIMHYGVDEFPNNEVPVVKDASKKGFGRVYYKELSFFDVRAVNLHYGCSAHCEPKSCPGSAFLNKTCQCEGPEDYAVRKCVNLLGDAVCNDRADRNHCDLFLLDMRHNCRKACNTCFKYGEHGVHERKKVCKDHNDNCASWAKTGECQRNEAWMKSSCPRSCKVCTPTAAQLAKEAALTTAKPCLDIKTPRECRGWKLNGNCNSRRYRTYMMLNCFRTCSGCVDPNAPTTTPGPCLDVESSANCRSYRGDGYCHSHQYHEWMRERCALTCEFCTPPSTTAAPTASAASGQNGCTDKHASCATWAGTGECTANPYWMSRNCQVSCNTCPGVCSNLDTRCAGWASNGDCARNAAYMNQNCRAACNQCRK